ncbi:MAG: hypothetical protein GWN51_10890, partial [Gemmatimonadetes bacterium]|nr:hypothetical protein [Gemmatimonadota bacterium]NIT67431.1 hypothetical protein [Gemmatimonadota bacterium]NIV24138.1 hypothetical protein [Gemmatimonadota bacterium]NIW76055.1 hypothetical protein [Gemmatimonadota bacterium]NIY36008.1 hypothetical protein [Gemmatimonadota bacterium]
MSGGQADAHQGAGLLRWIRYDRRYEAPLLITVILLGAHLSFGILETFGQTL